MFTATRETIELNHFEQIVLTGAGHEVKLLPGAGFNLWYWHFDGEEVLMKPVDLSVIGTKYGIPVLFPTPNRIKDGTYVWKGRTYTMDKRGTRVVIHGLVKDEPFTVTALSADETQARVTGEIRIEKGNDLYPGYPFPCTLRVTYILTAEGLRMEMEAVNDGDEEMPFGFAVHPYFSKHGDASKVRLNVPVQRVYETDEALIPSGVIARMEASRLPDGKDVDSLYLDNVFRGMTEDSESVVDWANFSLHVTASDCYRNVVVYTPHDRPGFCIEPQTCSTNSINLYSQGLIDESGLLILQPGQTFSSWVNYRIEKKASAKN